jgi:hypothetical protein
MVMIYGILEWTCTIAALAAFGYRLATLPGSAAGGRGRVDPALVALTVYFLGSFLSFFVGLDAISPHIAGLFHTTNITIILSHGAVIVLTAAQQVVLIYWAHPPESARPRAVRWIAAYGVVLAALVTMFVLILPGRRHGTSETSSLLNMANPAFAAYLVVFTAAAGIGQVITLRMSWTYRRIAGRAWLRRSMWLVVAGAALILVYCAMRLAEIVGTRAGVDMTPANPVQWLAGDVGSLLELLGWTAPGWGPLLGAAGVWIANYARYQRLRPLWLAMHRATPDIALDAPRSRLADLVLVRKLGYRLYRRVIEIMDGERALRPYLDSEAPATATATATATGDADRLRAALLRVGHGGAGATGESLAQETRRLVALAKAYRRQPVPRVDTIAEPQRVPSP